MRPSRGDAFNSYAGHQKGQAADIDKVMSISIVDQEKNLPPFKEKVHPWTSIMVTRTF
jgi:hypothetical protein